MGVKARILAAILVVTAPVAAWEGRNLFAHLDPIGKPTICEGWTHGVKLGDVATPEQCDALTRRALEEAGRTFTRWVPASVIERMPIKSIGAFLSFIYNAGPGAAGVKDGFVWLKNGRHSTMLLHLQAGRIAEACAELPKWTRAGGKQWRGLAVRRAGELALCEADL